MNPNTELNQSLAREGREKQAEFLRALAAKNLSLPADPPDLADQIGRIFAWSDFVAKTATQRPGLFLELWQSGAMQREYADREFPRRLTQSLGHPETESELCIGLRDFRHQEMVRIAWRDLSGWSGLSQTMQELSDLADACLEGALAWLHQGHCRKYGQPLGKDGSPQSLVILGMGKLGAGELNFSSDIDLIFAFPQAGQTDGEKGLSNDEFFLKLCRRLLAVIGQNQPEGFVFRPDMELRPYGKNGPLVMSFDAMERYYQMQGREWERYAWIKARAVAGDKAAGRNLLSRLSPFIYRRYLDYGVFESLREMKAMIGREVRRRGMAENIKLGPGGIREIEFFAQVFQLIRGGVEPALQERRLDRVLDILAVQGYISQGAKAELEGAYRFLRKTEHRLQAFSDSQTHQLPADPLARHRLAVSMGFDDWSGFSRHLQIHREQVHDQFNRLLALTPSGNGSNGESDEKLRALWDGLSGEPWELNLLAELGFQDPEAVIRKMGDFQKESETRALSGGGQERLARLIPMLLRQLGPSADPELALDRILALLKAAERRTCYLSLLLENPDALTHLVRLANASSWILNFITQHPVLLDELLDPRTLYRPPSREEMAGELRARLSRIPADDLEYQLEELRIFRQANTLRVAAADISEALPLMKVSDHLSEIAEVVLNEVVDMAWNHLVVQHGQPVCQLNGTDCPKGFAVLAYGKLGGLELGYGSDLDMVFLHAGTLEESRGGRRPVDTPRFFARLGQRVLHILTAHTQAGILYEADMRLRPSGSSGLLVSHVDAFREYMLNKAWTWEKQALVRARPVCGNPRLSLAFDRIRKEVLSQYRDPEPLRQEVCQMRQRLRQELHRPREGVFDLKQGPGGMVDIEFLVQYLVLCHAHQHPALLGWTDNVRLFSTLADEGILDDITAYTLRMAYLSYRTMGHRLSLQQKPSLVPKGRFEFWRERVKQLWKRFMKEAI